MLCVHDGEIVYDEYLDTLAHVSHRCLWRVHLKCIFLIFKTLSHSGIFNDLGSGSNIDITVIRNDSTVSRHRGYENAAGDAATYKAKYPRPAKLTPPPGTTFVIEETFKPHKAPAAVYVPSVSTAMEV